MPRGADTARMRSTANDASIRRMRMSPTMARTGPTTWIRT